jgi:hypothetical protein
MQMATNQLRLLEEDGSKFEVETLFIAVDNHDEAWFMSDDKARTENFISNWNTFIQKPVFESYAAIMTAVRNSLL